MSETEEAVLLLKASGCLSSTINSVGGNTVYLNEKGCRIFKESKAEIEVNKEKTQGKNIDLLASIMTVQKCLNYPKDASGQFYSETAGIINALAEFDCNGEQYE
jgi:hypothetical protein